MIRPFVFLVFAVIVEAGHAVPIRVEIRSSSEMYLIVNGEGEIGGHFFVEELPVYTRLPSGQLVGGAVYFEGEASRYTSQYWPNTVYVDDNNVWRYQRGVISGFQHRSRGEHGYVVREGYLVPVLYNSDEAEYYDLLPVIVEQSSPAKCGRLIIESIQSVWKFMVKFLLQI